jgi:hypothetical protein
MHPADKFSDFWVKSDYNPMFPYGTDIMQDDYGEHNGYPREQRLADARLIVAAPELYSIAVETKEILEKLGWADNSSEIYSRIEKLLKEINNE